MQQRSFIRSIQSAIGRIPSFVAWLFKPEKFDGAPCDEAPPPTHKHTSFLRWVFSCDALETEVPIQRGPKEPSFFAWLLAPERLESNSTERNGAGAKPTDGT